MSDALLQENFDKDITFDNIIQIREMLKNKILEKIK